MSVEIAIMGHGVVGSGVVQVLLQNAKHIAQKAGQPVEIKRILDLRSFPDSPLADLFTTDFEEIASDPEIRVVVETMGGLHPAYDYVRRCLVNGKSVVTSNKELVAEKGDELLALAKESGLNFLFEASVGGGIPILRPLDQCLAANEVLEVMGILNGTTNFMLTKMVEEGMTFSDALILAQRLGYAERDPAADIEGSDAARKICILASLAFGKHVYPRQVATDGIGKITLADVRCAEKAGRVIKLIGRARHLDDGRISCFVSPVLLPKEHLLAQVRDVFNGILVRGNMIGDVIFYGRGAGKLPTASAVVADIIDEVKHLASRKMLFWTRGEEGYVAPAGEEAFAAMVRLRGVSESDVRAAVPGAVTVERDPVCFITPKMTGKQLASALSPLGGAVETALRLME